MAEDVKARVGSDPLRHVESVERIHDTEQRTQGSGGDACLGWTQDLYDPQTEHIKTVQTDFKSKSVPIKSMRSDPVTSTLHFTPHEMPPPPPN